MNGDGFDDLIVGAYGGNASYVIFGAMPGAHSTAFHTHDRTDEWIFILAGLLALIIALITISFQSIKAAIANPVKSLRTE